MGFGQIEAFDHGGMRLAYERIEGVAPAFMWLGGFKSDMMGGKATALAAWAQDRGRAFLRFDYSGHGQSGGAFDDGTISVWLSEALALIDARTHGPLVLVGSSMGGWLALLAARARPDRVQGMILIAPAVDMTQRLMWDQFPDLIRREIEDLGYCDEPSDYGAEPYRITKSLIADGRTHLLMAAPIIFAGPVHILQGGEDPDVPASHAREVADLIEGGPVTFELIPDGDHRLSRAGDLARLIAVAEAMIAKLGG
jgi:pimeloyl-ACP methyl ester carboxylesterase